MLGGGDETRFAQMMTLRARALGMSRTTFRNASGLPDPAQITTARDMALLGRRLVADFPAYYGYFSAPSFTFRGRTFRNHDRLLELYPGTDGLKTGYTRDSGYNLVSSAARGGVRLVGVVLGGASGGERDRHMMNLLDDGFEKADVPIARRETPPAGLRVPALIASAHAAPAGRGRAAAAPAVRFGIQAGAYPTQPEARKAALVAQRLADGGQIRLEAAAATPRKGRKPGKAAATLWRAQVTGLTATEAQAACAALARRKLPCMVLKPDSGQLASR
jgi:D-alanyl-D-alanine carboxypeptidase